MNRDTQNFVRRMVGIDGDNDKIIGPKLKARLERMEKSMQYVSRQSSFGREALASIIATVPEADWWAPSPLKLKRDAEESARVERERVAAQAAKEAEKKAGLEQPVAAKA